MLVFRKSKIFYSKRLIIKAELIYFDLSDLQLKMYEFSLHLTNLCYFPCYHRSVRVGRAQFKEKGAQNPNLAKGAPVRVRWSAGSVRPCLKREIWVDDMYGYRKLPSLA